MADKRLLDLNKAKTKNESKKRKLSKLPDRLQDQKAEDILEIQSSQFIVVIRICLTQIMAFLSLRFALKVVNSITHILIMRTILYRR